MEQQTKYIDANKVLANKEKITVNIPKYIYDDMEAFSKLTGTNKTDIVTDALFDFFRYKTVTNDYLLGYGKIYFNLPLNKEFKDNAIADKTKLNQDRQIEEPMEQVLIQTVTNNLDVFNGVTYTANLENINHIGVDFKIIPKAIKPTNTIKFHELDINLTDALYVFYYEVSNNHNIDVYLINPIDAINRLSSVKSIFGDVLIGCLQEMGQYQKEINNNYHLEMQELHNNNQYVSNDKERAIKDKYTAIFLEVLKDISIKYNNPNIKLDYDASKGNIQKFTDRINEIEQSLKK